ncbi:uncharacterized protein B0J16DRAFT_373910 [Fusarium flagelliforme]|uniref:uncharacterized protein n=1 Tax=Fusarium flagelliforme TaxID=2675880 RepID=UPI001E8E1FCF|nr:uncharacterized protein B0J16DRAFT_373910 [Fusarium flagelliforme]KAH7183466.1 hypothetical protein B0J16DRAFT_373910 [Fusarium flagelliforme]
MPGGLFPLPQDSVAEFGLYLALIKATDLLRYPEEIDIEQVCRRGTQPVPSQVPVHQILKERYHKGEEEKATKRQEWNGESIREIVSRVDAPNNEDGTDKNQKEAQIRLTPARVLTYLNDAMNLEKENLAFPYLSMNWIAWQVLMPHKTIGDTMTSSHFYAGNVPDSKGFVCRPNSDSGPDSVPEREHT